MPRLRAALAAHLGGLPSTFWWLWVGVLVSALATFVFPFLALFLTARGFSPARAGMVASLFGAGMLVSGPIAGALADRFGRRPTMLFSLLGAAGSAGVLAFLSSLPAIAAVVFLFGLASQAVKVPSQATVADIVPLELRPRAFGLLYWANNAGTGASLLAGGLLASRGWALPFLADAATTLAFALLVFGRVPETRPSSPASGARQRGAAHGGRAAGVREPGYREVLADRHFAAFLALHVLFGTAFWQMLTSLPIDMARHGFSPAAFGTVLSVNTALIVLVQPFASRLTGRFSKAAVLAAASLLVGLGYGAYGLCSTAPQYALATGVWSLGEIGYLPVASALVADLAPPELRGRYAGAYGLGFGLAGFVAPIVGPWVMQSFGAPTLWSGCLAAGAAVAAGQLALGRTRSHATMSKP
jgi:MFS family permease